MNYIILELLLRAVAMVGCFMLGWHLGNWVVNKMDGGE